MKSMSFFPLWARLCLLACLACCLSGCESFNNKGNLDPAELARKVKILRDEALSCYQRFYASQTDGDQGVDIEALNCFVDRRKSVVVLVPNAIDCPRCYAEYAEALRMLGAYYRTLALAQAEQAKNAVGEKKAEISAHSAANWEKSDSNFKMSLQQFGIHFQTGNGSPAAYWSAFEAAYQLKKYNFALEYLNKYELNNSVSEAEKVKLAKWRQRTALMQKKKVREEVRKELEN